MSSLPFLYLPKSRPETLLCRCPPTSTRKRGSPKRVNTEMSLHKQNLLYNPCVCVLVALTCLILCNPMGCPWNSLGKNTGVGFHALLQGIFLTQGWNQGHSLSSEPLGKPPYLSLISPLIYLPTIHHYKKPKLFFFFFKSLSCV